MALCAPVLRPCSWCPYCVGLVCLVLCVVCGDGGWEDFGLRHVLVRAGRWRAGLPAAVAFRLQSLDALYERLAHAFCLPLLVRVAASSWWVPWSRAILGMTWLGVSP